MIYVVFLLNKETSPSPKKTKMLYFRTAKTIVSKISSTLITFKIDEQSLNSNRLITALYNKTPYSSKKTTDAEISTSVVVDKLTVVIA